MLICFGTASAAEVLASYTPQPVHQQLVVDLISTPTRIYANNQNYVVYELQVTNYEKQPIELVEITIQIAGKKNAAHQVIKYDEKSILNLLYPIGSINLQTNKLQVGQAALLFFFLPVDKFSSHHFEQTISYKLMNDDQAEQKTYTVNIKDLTIAKKNTLIISKPVAGDKWVAVNGPANASLHRRTNLVANGKLYLPERYAIDFIQVNQNNDSFSGNEFDNKSYYCYGKEVLAVASGKVIAAFDEYPDNTPHINKYPIEIDVKSAGGNYIYLDLGNGKYAYYAHLIPGSIKKYGIKVGQYVNKGQILGLIGNTGNSSEPHLHFHVVDQPAFPGAQGIPYAFDRFQVYTNNNVLKSYTNQLVLENDELKFN